MYYLTGDNVSIEKLRRVAKTGSLCLWPDEKNPFLSAAGDKELPDTLVVLSENLTQERLAFLFSLPIRSVIDGNATLNRIRDFLIHKISHKYSGHLSFLLTGPVIYNYDVARLFSDALWRRLKFSENRHDGIHLALHEALVNGLIHGNLNLSSALRQNAGGFVSYSKIIGKRLNSPTFSKKAISISARWNKTRLEIKIKDEGMGYSLAQILKRAAVPVTAKSGRGLRMIAAAADSCTIENYGKEITLSFLREKESVKVIPTPLVEEGARVDKTDLSQSRVLIVEDNESNQALLAGLLAQIGIHKLEVASDGVDGLNKVVSFLPDLIILDITMPRMDGYEVLQRLKSTEMTRDIPVLIQTASDTREARDRTFKSGASDFITKPINPLEFFARVRVHLENRRLILSLKKQLDQINHELMTAQDMQMQLLPLPEVLNKVRSRHRLNIASFFAPSTRLGGDFWQILPLPHNRVGIYLCDFSGHGLAAALNTFRMHTMIFQQYFNIEKPSEFLSLLNKRLCQLLPRGQFATFFFGVFDMERQKLSYAGAGSPPPFLKSGQKIDLLQTQGLPLGISPDAVYDDYMIDFKAGDKFLLYSDALNESLSPHKTRLGETGLLALAQPAFDCPNLQEGLSLLTEAFFELIPPPPQDDITAILIEGMPRNKEKE